MQNIASYPLATDVAIQQWLSCGLYTSPIADDLRRTIDATETLTVPAELITIGPAGLWINCELVEHFRHAFSYMAVQCVQVHLRLKPRYNEVFIQGDMLGWREARLALDLERGRVLTPESIHHVDYQCP